MRKTNSLLGHSINKVSPKKLLFEVSLIRPIVIFLLVVMHSFTKIAAGGFRTNDYQLPDVYQWLCHLISGFRIETIALVAGYVFAYQSLDMKRQHAFQPFLVKKLKRLILPMLFFGVFYYALFLYTPETFSMSGFLLKWFSGCGHLWFLPMLFWCFISIWLIDYYHLSSWKTLVVFAFIAILPLPLHSLPLGFSRLPHFLFFVYGGYYLYENRRIVWQHGFGIKSILLFWITYVMLIIVRHTLLNQVPDVLSEIEVIIWKLLKSIVDLLVSCIGVMALYCTISRKTIRSSFTPQQWVIRSSEYCYGVYVYHQFLLVGLYHYLTPSLVSLINPYLVPWLGFIIAFFVSWILTKLTLCTRFGRFLIG